MFSLVLDISREHNLRRTRPDTLAVRLYGVESIVQINIIDYFVISTERFYSKKMLCVLANPTTAILGASMYYCDVFFF